MKRVVLSGLSIAVLMGIAGAQQPAGDALPKGFKTTPLLKSSETASKKRIEYPKTGQAEIVSVIGELEPGGRTSRHQHPVPVYVYVLEGTITVQADGGPAREYKTGQAFIEDINHWHQAFNKGSSPTKILVVFAGEAGKPTTITAK